MSKLKAHVAYYQSDVSEPVLIPDEDRAIYDFRKYRKSRLSARDALECLLGQAVPMSSILGSSHRDSPNAAHPIHIDILESLITRLTVGAKPSPTQMPPIKSSVAVIGGPKASRHAALLFGLPDKPSILARPLPISFRYHSAGSSLAETGRSTSFIFNGNDIHEEHFLLTSLPMGEHRLLNISSLSRIGGKAADFLFGDEQKLEELFVRTRPFSSGGWQAAFKVVIENGKPVKMSPEFSVFEVDGIDFNSSAYPLNNADFLYEPSYDKHTTSTQSALKSNKFASNLYFPDNESMKRDEISELTDEIAAFLKRNPDKAVELKKRTAEIFTVASATENEHSPNSAHARWSDEAKKTKAQGRRNPAQFVREEYKTELQNGTLTRARLFEIDPPLYQAYAGWIRPGRHPEDDLGLLTAPRSKLEHSEETLAHKRALGRAAARRHRERKSIFGK